MDVPYDATMDGLFEEPEFDAVGIISELVSGRDLADLQAGADGPDWHCTVHGEWGVGEYACPYAEPGPSGCFGQF
ncbi:hypothetical protein [Kitasatospora sp. NPDC056731]|uniref:hypothetical protein n=1 Tax=Kitasatospora sp. NPDC056731 TaxID=3155422 RepID=UPI00344207DD